MVCDAFWEKPSPTQYSLRDFGVVSVPVLEMNSSFFPKKSQQFLGNDNGGVL